MLQGVKVEKVKKGERTEKIEEYIIDGKKYKVISKCIENNNSMDKLYEILCKFAISKIDTNV